MRSLFFAFIVLHLVYEGQSQSSNPLSAADKYDLPAEYSQCFPILFPESLLGYQGSWVGESELYNEVLQAYRPSSCKIVFDENCFYNASNGEIFAIGTIIETYPAYRGLSSGCDTQLIMVGSNGTKPFLRIVHRKYDVTEFTKIYTDKVLNIRMWEATPSDKQRPLKMRIIMGITGSALPGTELLLYKGFNKSNLGSDPSGRTVLKSHLNRWSIEN